MDKNKVKAILIFIIFIIMSFKIGIVWWFTKPYGMRGNFLVLTAIPTLISIGIVYYAKYKTDVGFAFWRISLFITTVSIIVGAGLLLPFYLVMFLTLILNSLFSSE